MKILVCSPSFPTIKTIDFVFVDQLCRAFADLGNEVVVIAPQSLTKCLFRHIPIAKRHSWYQTAKGNKIELFRPYTITFGYSKIAKFFKNGFQNAVNRASKRIKEKPDVYYGHFWCSIFALYPLAKKNDIPLFGASGEENVSLYVHKTEEYKKAVRETIRGVINVSKKNQKECLELNLISPEKTVVIPNAVDHSLFRPKDRTMNRVAFGIENDDFVVAFVGQFVSRKGITRLDDALTKIGDNKIKSFFIGSGSIDPHYENIVFKGRVPHNKLPDYLSAADVFVLPTDNEGCSNAIIEAMACGLPIISTDASFNYDILDGNNSIMVNCHDIDEISEAISEMKRNKELRLKLSEGALVTAAGLSIEKRALKIVDFMKTRISKR